MGDQKNQDGIFSQRMIPRQYHRHVYIIDNGNRIKIGKSKNPQERIRTIETQSGERIKSKWVSPCLANHSAFESFLHSSFAEARYIGEYFSVNFDCAVKFAEKHIEKYLMTPLSLDEAKRKNKAAADIQREYIDKTFKEPREKSIINEALHHAKNSYAVTQATKELLRIKFCIYTDSINSLPGYVFDDATTQWLVRHESLMSGVAIAFADQAKAIVGQERWEKSWAACMQQAVNEGVCEKDIDEIIGVARSNSVLQRKIDHHLMGQEV